MKYIKKFESMNELNVGDILIAKRDYLDLFKFGEEYEIYDIDDVGAKLSFGKESEKMYSVSNNGKKISGWPLKEYEIEINFNKK